MTTHHLRVHRNKRRLSHFTATQRHAGARTSRQKDRTEKRPWRRVQAPIRQGSDEMPARALQEEETSGEYTQATSLKKFEHFTP